ncbi:MAG: hypothetical protein ACPGYV_01780 [Phycisphaeraceae bacterium]
MITFDGLDLFSAGPSLVELGPIESREATADSPGSIGGEVVTQGLSPRVLTQQGTLVADSASQLRTLIEAIEALVGTEPATLVDQNGQAWRDCLMRSFAPALFYRLGPRHAAEYAVTYLQMRP